MLKEEKLKSEKEGIFQVVGMIGGRSDGLGNASTYCSTDFCFGEQKTAIDSNILTSAILTKEFYEFLSQESKGAKIFITEKNQSETIGNLEEEGCSKKEAEEKFNQAVKDLNLEILPRYEGCEADATKIFEKATKLFKIKKIETFLQDCVILVILDRNGINNYYSNDEDLEIVCDKILPHIKVKQIKTKEEIKRRELKGVDKMLFDAGLIKRRGSKRMFKRNKSKR